MTLPSPADLRAALAAHPLREIPALPGRTNDRPAGILLPIRWHPQTLSILATQRSSHLRDHAGEVVFPGGKPEPGDPDLTATALREAEEELGIEQVDVLGHLSAIPLFTSDFRLVPTVGRIDHSPIIPDPAEVACVFELDLLQILRSESILAIAWPEHTGFPPSPVFEMGGPHNPLMYGGTAICLYELLEVLAGLLGRPMPGWDVSRWTWSMEQMAPAHLP